MIVRLHPGHPAFATPSRTAEMRGHLRTQDSTISRIFGRRQNPWKLCGRGASGGKPPEARRYPRMISVELKIYEKEPPSH